MAMASTIAANRLRSEPPSSVSIMSVRELDLVVEEDAAFLDHRFAGGKTRQDEDAAVADGTGDDGALDEVSVLLLHVDVARRAVGHDRGGLDLDPRRRLADEKAHLRVDVRPERAARVV